MTAQNASKKTSSTWLDVEGELTLHTTNAQNFFRGRIKDSCSMAQFNRQVLAIQHAINHDDPFAEWVLLRVYDAIVQAHRKLHKIEVTLRQLLVPEEGMVFKLARHKQPKRYPVWFSMPYTRAVLYLFISYDRIVRSHLTLNNSGIKLTDTTKATLHAAGELLRHVLIKPQEWKKTNVTRDDVRNNTPLAQEACLQYAALGVLPERVLAGTLRAPSKIEFANTTLVGTEKQNTL